jgi:hypothetical protein
MIEAILQNNIKNTVGIEVRRVTISVMFLRVLTIMDLIPVPVKPRTIKLVFAASLLSRQH